jgi:hypothetical protein
LEDQRPQCSRTKTAPSMLLAEAVSVRDLKYEPEDLSGWLKPLQGRGWDVELHLDQVISMLGAVSILPPLFMLDALDGCTHPRR